MRISSGIIYKGSWGNVSVNAGCSDSEWLYVITCIIEFTVIPAYCNEKADLLKRQAAILVHNTE